MNRARNSDRNSRMFSKELPYIVIAFVGLFAVIGLVEDISNTARGGAIDLRNRVTGARLAEEKIDPYVYKWDSTKSERFCDPYNLATQPVSKTTVTPPTLVFNTLFSGLNYKTIQWLWLLIQYGAIIIGVLAWSQGRPKSVLIWGIALTVMFCTTVSWRLHVDRGQIYMGYAMLLLVLVWLSRQTEGSRWRIAEGICGAFLVGGRPIFVGQFAIPFAARNWSTFLWATVGGVLLLVFPMLIYGSGIWTQYFAGMAQHGELYLGQVKPARAPMVFPPTVEGIPIDQLAGFAKIPFGDTSLYKLVSFQLPWRLLVVGWGLFMLGGLFYTMVKAAAKEPDLLWWAASAWMVIGDFFLPAYRNIYNDVLMWPMLLLGLTALKHTRPREIWIVLCGGLLFMQWAVSWMPTWFIPWPSIVGFFFAVGVVIYSLRFHPHQEPELSEKKPKPKKR